MARYGDIDYPTYAKGGFLLGATLLALGAVGELAGTALFGTLPGWETTLLTNFEILGILLGLLSPLVFGVVLPLTE